MLIYSIYIYYKPISIPLPISQLRYVRLQFLLLLRLHLLQAVPLELLSLQGLHPVSILHSLAVVEVLLTLTLVCHREVLVESFVLWVLYII